MKFTKYTTVSFVGLNVKRKSREMQSFVMANGSLIETKYDVRPSTAKSRIKIPDGKISRTPKVRSRRSTSRRIPLVTGRRRGLAIVGRRCHLRWGGPPEKRRNAMLLYTFHDGLARRRIYIAPPIRINCAARRRKYVAQRHRSPLL